MITSINCSEIFLGKVEPVSNEINFFSFVYANELKNFAMCNFGLKNLNYGNFQGYDVNGFQTNEFHANDLIFFSGVSKMIMEDLTLGMNLEIIDGIKMMEVIVYLILFLKILLMII